MDTNTISNNCDADNISGDTSDFGSGGYSGDGIAIGNGAVPVPAPAPLTLLSFGLLGLYLSRRWHGLVANTASASI